MVKISSKQMITGEKYRFTLLTPHLIRMEYSEEGKFVDSDTQIVVNREFPEFEFDLVESESLVEVYTESFHLRYDKQKFSSRGLVIEMKSNFTDFNNRWYYGEKIETLKGTTRTLDNVDGATELDEGIISRQGYAVLDDSHSAIATAKGNLQPRKTGGIDLYFFGYQHQYKQALKDFYQLTGPSPIVPRYALGNWWSRFWAYTDESYLALINQFTEEQVPLAVSVVDMDWHLRDIPKRFGSGWTGYSWNKELFPNPDKFLQELHDRGLKVSLNVHPSDGIRAFEDAYPAISKRMKLNVLLEEPAEFDLTNETFVKGYFEDVHHPLEEQGVDFWWIDWQQGEKSKEEGLDPLWLLNQYHFEDLSQRKEGLILSRYAGPGSHRYPIGFSGDSIISWASLQFQPYFTATATNIGYTWWSHDIGGHMGGSRDDELTLRWMQFGTFSPINRLHSSSSPFNSKEPWNFSGEIQVAMKETLRERHRLLPYLYTANVETSEKGEALIQPLYYSYPEENEAYLYQNNYLFGQELLVVPIVHQMNPDYQFAKEEIWLPEGKWYDFYTGNRYAGQAELSIFRQVNELAVFAKAGGIIPTDPNVMETKPDCLPEKIEWKIFPGDSNCYEMIEDLNGKRCITVLSLDWKRKLVSISTSGDTSILPEKRQNQISLYCVENEDGSKLINNIFHAEIIDQLQLPVREIVKQEVTDLLFERIDRPAISYELKNQLWTYLSQKQELMKRLATVKHFKDEWLTEMLFEVFYIEES
ncbi:TIM-barrel domain-containing protein [Enterococcus thailandicus]|uniref:glycoside hydrolase family 31 protein n=1 Tax=Enterococcus TaxID=1350 RepID=UPI00244D8DB1|nr:TIM-barrel domain-containing protein [Enterococcus thailandicus]MDK4351270.1 alpha-xylosidase [Enterococcus thailandicus]MDT2732996.1 glycoside hydrolase family 31 protein [Enterococcus thailandicus]MDT2846528.1 glycoside hydrolase family 31 protein [Enterococcus thailandicus]GMC00756.1 alpha-xylosidase [Enterococcus thailandicus]